MCNMNSFVITVSALLLALASAKPLDKEAMKKAAKELILLCRSKVGAMEADLQALVDHKIPESHEGLCLLECVFDSSKLMQNGKYNKNGFIEGFKPFVAKDPAKQKDVERLADTCEKEVGKGSDDKCETAKMLVTCIVKNGSEHGLEIPTAAK